MAKILMIPIQCHSPAENRKLESQGMEGCQVGESSEVK